MKHQLIFVCLYSAVLFLDKIARDVVASSPTSQPTSQPSLKPTVRPSVFVSENLFMTVVAGSKFVGKSGDGGPATAAEIYAAIPYVDHVGNMYIPDNAHSIIRRVTENGIITTFGGNGTVSSSGASGPITSVGLYSPWAVVGDTAGAALYLSDRYYVWKYLFSTGTISVIAGTGTVGFGGDGGPASSAKLFSPMGIWLTTDGELFIGDAFNHRIRRIFPASGNIATVVGSSSSGGYGGDNGPAVSANLNYPVGLYLNSNGQMFIADQQNSRIRFVDTNQLITTFAGTGVASSFNGDNIAATLANIGYPYDVKGDSLGNIYFPDGGNSVIRMIVKTGLLTTVFGTVGSSGFSAGLSSRFSSINGPEGIWIDSMSTIYFSDINSVRKSVIVRSPTSLPSTRPNDKPSSQPSHGPSTQPTGQPIAHPSSPPSNDPSGQPSGQPSSQPSCIPTGYPIGQPSAQPSRAPTRQPFSHPSSIPTLKPSATPSKQPTTQPSDQPTTQPTSQPNQPTGQPSALPSVRPTRQPTSQPSSIPTMLPSSLPTRQPYGIPTLQPYASPSTFPTTVPTHQPTSQPSAVPTRQSTTQPTSRPSFSPTTLPTNVPTVQPTEQPSNSPSSTPSCQPSNKPSSRPSTVPTVKPSEYPSRLPSNCPSVNPSRQPSNCPSVNPSTQPTTGPTQQPTVRPSRQPISRPSSQPSVVPSLQPITLPTSVPSRQPTLQPSCQPSSIPSSQPTLKPSVRPSMQPSSIPTKQPLTNPSSPPSSQPLASPTSLPSSQPTDRPTCQPTNDPSSQPTSQPTKNKLHCTIEDNSFYSYQMDDCVKCPLNSFLNHTGDETCYCNAGYSRVGLGLNLNCTLCPLGTVSAPANQNCTECPAGSFADATIHTCELCPVNFYSSSGGQTQCYACPAGRATVTLGSTSIQQCVSPVPNFTLGFLALFVVVGIFSWYIVFGKFQRVSFERRTNTVGPYIEKCKYVLCCMEELKRDHLITAQKNVRDNKNLISTTRRKRKIIKFLVISFLILLSFIVFIVLALAFYCYFTYHALFTSLILWRGLRTVLKLNPIFKLFAEALRGITQFIGFPVDVLFVIAIPFLYLFDALASINLNLSSVNVTCSGSQAPIELLINCFILGLLIIVVRSDYQLLFNVLLNNVNESFALNNLEQQLKGGNLSFSICFLGIIFSVCIMIDPFQVVLRYCMGFVRLDSFMLNHGVSHEVSEACDQVPGARHFDSFLGYTSTIFAWWLILPTVYCLAEVVVPKCRKIDGLKMFNVKSVSKKTSTKIIPAEFFIDESMCSKKVEKALCEPDSEYNEGKDEENDLQIPEKVDNKIAITEDVQTYLQIPEKVDNKIAITEDVQTPEFPNDLSAKFPDTDEKALVSAYQRGYLDHYRKAENDMMHCNRNAMSPTAKEERKEDPSQIRKLSHKTAEKVPLMLVIYYYCKKSLSTVISIDLLISMTFAFWIDFVKENTSQKVQKKSKQTTTNELTSAKQPSVHRFGFQLFVDPEQFLQAQVTKQRNLDYLWQKNLNENDHSLPSFYELSYVVQEELHEFVIQPFSSILAFIGIGHFFTPTGRYYWKVVFHNYKVFLLVCLGIWTDEAVEAYDLEEKAVLLIVNNKRKEITDSAVLLPKPSGRRFFARLLGFTITEETLKKFITEETLKKFFGIGNKRRDHQGSNNKNERNEHQKQNLREVLPSIIKVLMCSRVILFQTWPSSVLFATISMSLAPFPLFIFNEFLAETLPPPLIWGKINREMSIERELKSFVPLDPETNKVLSEQETISMLTTNYSWRIRLRGIVLFLNESPFFQCVYSLLELFFSFLLLIYRPDLLIYLVVILAFLIPFILGKYCALLLYLGNSLNLKDADFPSCLFCKKHKQNTAKVEPMVAMVDSSVDVGGEYYSVRNEEEVRMEEGNPGLDLVDDFSFIRALLEGNIKRADNEGQLECSSLPSEFDMFDPEEDHIRTEDKVVSCIQQLSNN
jgi:hypothetical protein